MPSYNQNLDVFINPSKSLKSGLRYDSKDSTLLNSLKKATSEQYEHDSTEKKEDFVGFVLRVENITKEDQHAMYPYEPGSFPMKKHRGRTKTPPRLVAVKVMIPELHYMLPTPQNTGSEDCQSMLKGTDIAKCWHPIIELYPTFYAQTGKEEIPKPGQIVRVRFGDLATREDPLYLGPEISTNVRMTNFISSGITSVSFGKAAKWVKILSPLPSPSVTSEERSKLVKKFPEWPSDGKFGRIIAPGMDYQITERDVLWATKMVAYESGTDREAGEAVLWTMALKMADNHIKKKGLGVSYYVAIRSYSQPISVRWRDDSKTATGGPIIPCKPPIGTFSRCPGATCTTTKPDASKCSVPALERRKSLQQKDDTEFALAGSSAREKVTNLVIKWATGKTDHPYPGATDFANQIKGGVQNRTRSDQKITCACRGKTTKVLEGKCPRGDNCLWQRLVAVSHCCQSDPVWYVTAKGFPSKLISAGAVTIKYP